MLRRRIKRWKKPPNDPRHVGVNLIKVRWAIFKKPRRHSSEKDGYNGGTSPNPKLKKKLQHSIKIGRRGRRGAGKQRNLQFQQEINQRKGSKMVEGSIKKIQEVIQICKKDIKYFDARRNREREDMKLGEILMTWIDLPFYSGKHDIETFFDWIKKPNSFFFITWTHWITKIYLL